MIVLIVALAVAIGAVLGVAAARYWQHNLAPGAREPRVLLDAGALLRELSINPDAYSLRPRAVEIVDAFEASQRKDS